MKPIDRARTLALPALVLASLLSVPPAAAQKAARRARSIPAYERNAREVQAGHRELRLRPREAMIRCGTA